MKIVKYDIVILGIVSAKSNELVAKGFKRHFDESSSFCLFCDYASYDIPIGAEFDCLVNLQTQKDYAINATLIDVTQQMAISFDAIPNGWKTVSRFMFSQKDLNLIKSEMPVIDVWRGFNEKFKLICRG